METIERTYESGNATMAFSETPGSAEYTFVLIHGIGMGRMVYAEVGAELSRRGRVLAVDLPGFGDSPEPGSAASLEETAEVVAGFIRETATGKIVLVGHSMGTQIVSEVALHQQDLISALVLIAPTVNRYERTPQRQAARMVQDLTGEGPKVLLMGLWQYAKTNPRWFINKLRFMLNHRLEDICAQITTPTLVLRGQTDRVCPRDWVQEIADAIPCSEMEEIDNRGHEAMIKSAEPVARMIMDFAEKTTAR